MITDQIALCLVYLPQLILLKEPFMIQSFRATLVKLKEMFSWYTLGNKVGIPPIPISYFFGDQEIYILTVTG